MKFGHCGKSLDMQYDTIGGSHYWQCSVCGETFTAGMRPTIPGTSVAEEDVLDEQREEGGGDA